MSAHSLIPKLRLKTVMLATAAIAVFWSQQRLDRELPQLAGRLNIARAESNKLYVPDPSQLVARLLPNHPMSASVWAIHVPAESSLRLQISGYSLHTEEYCDESFELPPGDHLLGMSNHRYFAAGSDVHFWLDDQPLCRVSSGGKRISGGYSSRRVFGPEIQDPGKPMQILRVWESGKFELKIGIEPAGA